MPPPKWAGFICHYFEKKKNRFMKHKEKNSFPVENMPALIRDFSENISEVLGVPVEFAAMSLISAYGTALGNKVRLKTEKYTNFPQLWTIIVAPSGTGKSEPLKIAYEPIRGREKKNYLIFQEQMKEWNTAKQAGVQSSDKPKQKRILCSDTTPEALFSLLSENGTLTICRDELAGHFQDIGRYSNNGEVAHHLSCFDNNDFSVDRKSEENAMMIFKPVLSMVGTIQPNVLQEVAKKNLMKENGYLQRCLFVYPENVERPQYSKSSLNPDFVKKHQEFMDWCFDLPDNCEFTLNAEAEELFIAFSNEITELVNASDNDYFKSMYSKMEIHVLRLALILANALYQTTIVTTPAMQYAIDLCRYFMKTGERLYQPEVKKYTNAELIRLVDETIGIKNISKFADGIDKNRVVVHKALEHSRAERILKNDQNAVMSAMFENLQSKVTQLLITQPPNSMIPSESEETECNLEENPITQET
jgi:hypothetical protein